MMKKKPFLMVCFIPLLFISCLAKRDYETAPSNIIVAVKPISSPGSDSTKEEVVSCPHSFSNMPLCYDIIWEKYPNEEEAGSFKLSFYSPDKASQFFFPTELSLDIILWMPSMGHGSTPVEIHPAENGIFFIRDVYFTMPGEWDIEIYLKKGSSLVAKSLYPFNL
jgi:hypothetical protein